MNNDDTIQFSQRMQQLPPYLFGMINRMKMEKRRKGDEVDKKNAIEYLIPVIRLKRI